MGRGYCERGGGPGEGEGKMYLYECAREVLAAAMRLLSNDLWKGCEVMTAPRPVAILKYEGGYHNL